MEQSELRAWENKCIQEEPPYCQAACPLHVDVRSMLRLLAENRLAEARKVLERTMPLSEIFARICDHPCEFACRRGDVDETIRIGALERALVEHTPAGPPPLLLPSKGRRAAIFGSGPSSLVAAHDLRRKGIEAVVRHGSHLLGGVLLNLSETRLPVRALQAGVEMLRNMGVIFEADPFMGPDVLEKTASQVDAVYIGLDDPWSNWALELARSADPLSLATSDAKVFAGGITGNYLEFSPISLALDGRKAVLSMERLFQGASLNAGREKEGAFPSRLYTSTKGVDARPAEPMPDQSGYAPDQAVSEAGRCLLCQCLECVKACVFMERYKGYPKKLAREIYNNLSVVQGMRQANRMTLSCSNCGLCAAICPHDFHMGAFCMTARAEMVLTGKMPGSAHDFALREQAAACGPDETFVSHQPGWTSSEACFFPGCQLAGSSPDHVLQTLDHLRAHLSGGVGVLLTCCGAPSQWAARKELLDQAVMGIRRAWEELGRPLLILGCTTCRQVLGEVAPEIPTRSLWKTLAEIDLPAHAAPAPKTLFLHDPCTAREQDYVQKAVRALLRSLGQPVAEPELTGALTECCGFGGLMEAANPALADKAARIRAERRPEDLLAYCAMCRDSLSRTGKPVFHLLDLLFPEGTAASQPVSAAPLIRKGRELPDRRQNRAWLRKRLAGEETMPKPHQGIKLVVDPSVKAVMDARRILDDDLQQAVHHAQSTQRRFVDPATGRLLAARRIGYATFWAEYEPVAGSTDTYRIHRAWTHRMTIKEQV
jgi:Fe-S oxidoreductase